MWQFEYRGSESQQLLAKKGGLWVPPSTPNPTPWKPTWHLHVGQETHFFRQNILNINRHTHWKGLNSRPSDYKSGAPTTIPWCHLQDVWPFLSKHFEMSCLLYPGILRSWPRMWTSLRSNWTSSWRKMKSWGADWGLSRRSQLTWNRLACTAASNTNKTELWIR